MSLKIIASELATAGVKYRIVTAGEQKDPENPPYSRKKFITSLNDKRLLKLLKILGKCAGPKDIAELEKKSKSFNEKEAGNFLVKMQATCDQLNEDLREANGIVKSLSGKSGINIFGCYSSGSSNAKLAIHHGDYKTDPAGSCTNTIIAVKRAMQHVKAARAKVVKEAEKRGLM